MSFGLGGFPIQRLASAAVTSEDEYAAQARAAQAAYASQAAALPTPMSPDALAQLLMQPQIDQQYDAVVRGQHYDAPSYQAPDTPWQSLADVTSGIQGQFASGDQAQRAAALGGQPGYDLWNGYANGGYGSLLAARGAQAGAIGQQAGAQAQADAAAARDRQQNQTIQQNAYSSQLGAGATGGLLSNWSGQSDGSPTSTVQPGSVSPTSSSSWGSTGLMGNNGYTPDANPLSTVPQTWGSTGQATQAPVSNLGWGGPFASKNPWSLG